MRRAFTIILTAALAVSLAPISPATAGVTTGFDDVADDSLFAEAIAWLRLSRITRGCNPPANTEFCPTNSVTRGEMAALLGRALDFGPTTTNRFVDDDDSVFVADIDRIAAAGITSGCNPPQNDRFCPDSPVTRGQMAAFLTRAFGLPASTQNGHFIDIGKSVFVDDIDRLSAAGITIGCNPPANDRFCPTGLVTREQFAAFIWRASNKQSPSVASRMVAAGDIARCSLTSDEATALLLDELLADADGVVAALGDTVYDDGSPQQYRDCYEPSWGRHRFRTRPAVGNHEYRTNDASGYFDYFGAAAGAPDTGWYSYSLGNWNVLALNSNCSEIGGCETGSDQEVWLRSQLASQTGQCTVAYMHHPRFSSGFHGDDDRMSDLWQVLDEYGADLVLAGHDHNYERFAPMHADGTFSGAGGIQSFVVGTGGTYLRPADTPRPGSEVLIDDRHGVLLLDLATDSYQWQFIDTEGSVLDEGTRTCG